MSEILITPDLCMQFLVWTSYYHDIEPKRHTSYRECGRFSPMDCQRLDEIRDAVFRCFDEGAIQRSCQQIRLAKEKGEPCPYTQFQLDNIFAREL